MITMLVSYAVVLRYMDSENRQVEEYWKNVMFESYIKGLESQSYLVEQSERNLRISKRWLTRTGSPAIVKIWLSIPFSQQWPSRRSLFKSPYIQIS